MASCNFTEISEFKIYESIEFLSCQQEHGLIIRMGTTDEDYYFYFFSTYQPPAL